MTEPRRHPEGDRRHPRISHQELRRQLLEADEERYRLRSELRAVRSAPARAARAVPAGYRRMAAGVGTLVVLGLAGGLVWQMCPSSAKADDRSSVRVAVTTVTPRLIVTASDDRPAAAVIKKATVRAATRPRAPHRAERIQIRVDRPAQKRPVPRPLSPGEFGRQRVAAS